MSFEVYGLENCPEYETVSYTWLVKTVIEHFAGQYLSVPSGTCSFRLRIVGRCFGSCDHGKARA